MPKISEFIGSLRENGSFIGTLDIVKNYSIYILIFLLPLFFTPWLVDSVDVSKQVIFNFLVFVAFFAWIIKTLVSGTINVNGNKIHTAIGALVAVYFLSAIFSISSYGSFWGWPGLVAGSFLSILCCAITYFLISTTFSDKDMFYAFVVLGVSAALAQLYGILQLVGLHLIPLDIAKNMSFNSIGSIGGLAIFSVILLPLWITFATMSKTWHRVVFFLNVVLTFVAVLLVNYPFVWILLLITSLLIIFFWFVKKDFFSGTWLFLPMFFLITSAFFIFVAPKIPWIPAKPVEISLSNKASFQINLEVLKKYPMLGSGPGTFSYDFNAYRNQEFNNSPLWNVEFNAGSSKVLTDVATVGVLGILAFFAVALLSLLHGLKYLWALPALKIKGQEAMPSRHTMILASSVALVVSLISSFLYNFNLSLLFIWFVLVAIVVGLVFSERKKYILKSSSLALLIFTFVFTLAIIFGGGFLLLEGQKQYANIKYGQALASYQQGNKEQAVQLLKVAASNNKNVDLYFRQLALFSVGMLQDKTVQYKDTAPTANDKNAVALLISDAIGAINTAIALNSSSAANWSAKGYICQNLIGFNNDSLNCAIAAYDKALELYPSNPYFYLQQGNVYILQAGTTQDQKSSMIKGAIEKYQQAIELKKDYSEAYLQMAVAARADGQMQLFKTSLQQASVHAQNNATMLSQIGLVYYQSKEWVAAQDQFTRALVLIPNYANALYYSGLTYEKQGQKDNAIAQFVKILQTNPDNATVQKIIDNIEVGKPALDGVVATPTPAVTP